MKKIITFAVFGIMLLIFKPSFVLGQNSLQIQMEKLIKENEELSLEMKKSNSGFISLNLEFDEIQKLFKKNKNKPEMQDSIEKRILNFNDKLSRQLQNRTDKIYKYNSNRIETICLLKKIDNIDSVNTRFNKTYQNLEIYSGFLDSEFKSFMKFEIQIDPIKSRFASLEIRFVKRL